MIGDGFRSRGPLGWTLPGTEGTKPGGSLYSTFPHPILMSYLCSGPQPHYEWNGFPWTDHCNMRGKKLRPRQWVSGQGKGRLHFHMPNWILGCSTWVSQRHLNLSMSRTDLHSYSLLLRKVYPRAPRSFVLLDKMAQRTTR